MAEDYQKCVENTLKTAPLCEQTHSLVNEPLGSPDLPSPSETGCGPGFNLGLLNSVNMHARNEEYMDAVQCAMLAAQSICNGNGFPDDKQPKDTFDPVNVPDRHKGLCSIIRACQAEVVPHFGRHFAQQPPREGVPK